MEDRDCLFSASEELDASADSGAFDEDELSSCFTITVADVDGVFGRRTVTPSGASPPERAACKVASSWGLRIVDVPLSPICFASSLSSGSFIFSIFWLVATGVAFPWLPESTGELYEKDTEC
jgi:hypothetical protein